MPDITISTYAGKRIYSIIEQAEDLIYATRHLNGGDIERTARSLEANISRIDDELLELVNLGEG